MPTPNEELDQLQIEYAKLKIKYHRYFVLRRLLLLTDVGTGLLSFAVVVSLALLLYQLFPSFFKEGWVILCIYGGLFMWGYLNEYLRRFFRRTVHNTFKISKSDYEKFVDFESNFVSRRIALQRKQKKSLHRQTELEGILPKRVGKQVNKLQKKELDLFELIDAPEPSTSTTSLKELENINLAYSQPARIDYLALNKFKNDIGAFGELFCFQLEFDLGVSEGTRVIHVSTISDSKGYDIVTIPLTGDPKYIEVKTTTGDKSEPFYLTRNELEAMQKFKNYWIYRVYNFNIELRKGDLAKIDCSKSFSSNYDIRAISFKVTPK